MALLVRYVDDLAVAVQEWQDFELIFKKLESSLKIKHTGTIQRSQDEGGRVTFLGREFCRQPGGFAASLHVRPDYLDSCFKEYGITNATRAAAPNILTANEEGHGSAALVT